MSDMEDHSPADLDASEVFSTLTESGVIDPDVIHDIIGVEIAVSTSASPATTPPPPVQAPFEEQTPAEEEDRDDTDSITTTNSDHSSVKPNRELKSILALSKEAKLDTNISHKRKTLDSVNKSRENSPKITKEEHQETVKKIIRIVSADGGNTKMAKYPVTAESEIETQSDDEKIPNKVKRKRDSLAELSPGGGTDDIGRKAKKSFTQDIVMFKNPVPLFQEGKDLFCWRCHRDGVNIACETCPRSFHQKCLKQVIVDVDHWPCPECVAILKAESTSTRSEAMKGMTLEHLCSLLKFAVSRMVQCTGSEPFIHPVNEKEFPVYKKYIIQPMNLTLLEKNIKDNVYGSTQAFEADAKWILHNSIIFNSYQSKITTAARGIVKICKQEMAEIENCPSCYLNANTKKNTWFVEVCPRPHLLVWAKLKGFPYWPAKAMCTNSAGMVDVRFFGAHDRAWVHYRDCYLYSDRDPNSYKQRRYDIENCVKELQLYVNNLKKIYGEVHLAPFKTLYEPDNETKMLKMLLPTYKDTKVKVLRVYEKTGNNDGVKKDDEQEKNSEVEVKTEPEENNELNLSKSDNLNNTIEGYGTDEDNKCNIDSEKRKLLQLNNDLTSNKDDEEDTQLKIRIANKLIKANVKSKGSFSQKLRTLKRNSTDKSIESDKSRRNSIQSEDSDKNSRDEVMEQSVNVSISSSVSDLSDNSEQKRKPVQVNIENTELSLSPQSKLKMTDKLIKRLSDGDENATKNDENHTNEDQSCSSTTKEIATQNMNQVESVNSTVDDEKTEKEPPEPVNSEQNKEEENTEEKVKEKESNKSDIIEDVDDSEGADPIDSSQINEADIRNIIHSSLNECNITIMPKEKSKTQENTAKTDVTSTTTENKKRKLSNEEPESQPKPKSIKIININKVIDKNLLRETIESTKKERSNLKKKERQSTETDSSDSNEKRRKIRRKSVSSMHSLDQDDQTIPQDLLAIEIKSEQESEGECSDIDYMEAKRKYLSALNISEKQKETTKEKLNEIRTRSKTEEKKERSKIDNLTRIIDEVALNTSGILDNRKMEKKKLVATVLSSSTPLSKNASGEIFVKSLSKMQSPKQRARKTFPTPKYDKQANGVQLKDILPKPTTTNSVTVAKVIVTSSAVDPITILTQSQNPEVVLIPTNQSGNYSMMPPLIASKNVKQIIPNTKQSQNYIPQNESDSESSATLLDTILNKPALAKTIPDVTNHPLVPTTSIIPILSATNSTSTATITTTTTTTTATTSSLSTANQQETQDELSILHTTVPRTLSRAVSDLLCRSMPKLKPRPPGILSSTFDTGVPSSAGPVAAKINSVAHRLGDYFRGMLIETIEDLSKTDDAEATILKLKLEIETLKHKHEVEMAEMQRNISTILKDIQTSIVEERNRVIEQVRAASEAEAQRRVEEAKSKQWCANCSKEAQFYCCWNTSYCDYPCQQKHWPKHMSKCTQSQNQSTSSASPTTIRSQTGQQLVLRPTNPPKGGFNRVFSKPTKVYMNRSGGGSGSGAPKTLTAFKTSTNNHITLVESTPGNFELLTNGPIVTHKVVSPKQNDAVPTASKTKSANNNNKSPANTSKLDKSQKVKETECES